MSFSYINTLELELLCHIMNVILWEINKCFPKIIMSFNMPASAAQKYPSASLSELGVTRHLNLISLYQYAAVLLNLHFPSKPCSFHMLLWHAFLFFPTCMLEPSFQFYMIVLSLILSLHSILSILDTSLLSNMVCKYFIRFVTYLFIL